MRRVRRLQLSALALLALQLPGLDLGLPLSWAAIALVLVTGLKLGEARIPAGLRLTSLLLLVATGVLAALLPGLGPSLLQGLASLLALAALLAQELGDGIQAREVLRRSLRLLAAALPLVLVLFLLTPRLGPLWDLPEGRTARTGLGDSVEPGAIARLVASDAPAARVGFAAGSPPPAAERYWRVLTLEHFDGRRWQALEPASPPLATPKATAPPAGARRDQLWLAEPSALPVLPWGGQGMPLDPALTLQADGGLRNDRPPIERRAYALTGTDAPAAWQRRAAPAAALAYPAGANPRLEALGRSWLTAGLAPPERLSAAQRWLQARPFRYSMTPGTLPRQAPLDAFLFEQREGFCEHYAAAFTALMRAAGVPARLVSGYLGGTWVPQLGGGGYLDLRQSDAHAWSEVWLDGEGWRRVDPTAWIAPARLLTPPAGAAQRATGPRGALGWLERQWRGLDLRWTGWLLGFDRRAQERLLERLLGARQGAAGLLLLAALGVALALALPLLRWGGGGAGDGLRRELERALRRLQRLGCERRPGEDLPSYCRRCGRRWPPLAADLEILSRSYERLRFGPPPAGPERWAELAELRAAGRRLRQLGGRCAVAHPPFDRPADHG